MKAWLYTNDIENYEQIGIYHDNPIITEHSDCYYVVAIVPNSKIDLSNTNLPSFDIHAGLCACFSFEGRYIVILNLF